MISKENKCFDMRKFIFILSHSFYIVNDFPIKYIGAIRKMILHFLGAVRFTNGQKNGIMLYRNGRRRLAAHDKALAHRRKT